MKSIYFSLVLLFVWCTNGVSQSIDDNLKQANTEFIYIFSSIQGTEKDCDKFSDLFYEPKSAQVPVFFIGDNQHPVSLPAAFCFGNFQYKDPNNKDPYFKNNLEITCTDFNIQHSNTLNIEKVMSNIKKNDKKLYDKLVERIQEGKIISNTKESGFKIGKMRINIPFANKYSNTALVFVESKITLKFKGDIENGKKYNQAPSTLILYWVCPKEGDGNKMKLKGNFKLFTFHLDKQNEKFEKNIEVDDKKSIEDFQVIEEKIGEVEVKLKKINDINRLLMNQLKGSQEEINKELNVFKSKNPNEVLQFENDYKKIIKEANSINDVNKNLTNSITDLNKKITEIKGVLTKKDKKTKELLKENSKKINEEYTKVEGSNVNVRIENLIQNIQILRKNISEYKSKTTDPQTPQKPDTTITKTDNSSSENKGMPSKTGKKRVVNEFSEGLEDSIRLNLRKFLYYCFKQSKKETVNRDSVANLFLNPIEANIKTTDKNKEAHLFALEEFFNYLGSEKNQFMFLEPQKIKIEFQKSELIKTTNKLRTFKIKAHFWQNLIGEQAENSNSWKEQFYGQTDIVMEETIEGKVLIHLDNVAICTMKCKTCTYFSPPSLGTN